MITFICYKVINCLLSNYLGLIKDIILQKYNDIKIQLLQVVHGLKMGLQYKLNK